MSTMTVSDLRAKRAHIWDQAKAFLDERRDARQSSLLCWVPSVCLALPRLFRSFCCLPRWV